MRNIIKENGEMEKITKDELIEKLGGTPLSDDELEMVSGGTPWDTISEAKSICEDEASAYLQQCIGYDEKPLNECLPGYCTRMASCGSVDLANCGY